MKFSEKSLTTEYEILKRKIGGELVEPITLDFTSVTAGVVKAGSPISASGVVANTSDAIGILLTDVYAENPVGALVKAYAVINTTNAKANSGVELDDDVKTALPNLVFEA